MDCEASVLQFSESSPIRDIVVDIDKPPFSFFKAHRSTIRRKNILFFFFLISQYPNSVLKPAAQTTIPSTIQSLLGK